MTVMAAQDRPTRAQFADLVRDRRTALGMSYATVETRTDGDVKRGWVHRLETGEPVTPPQLSQLEVLARVLEVPLHQLQDAAAAQFFGIDAVYPASGDARALVEGAERLTEEQRAQLLLLIEAFAPGPDA